MKKTFFIILTTAVTMFGMMTFDYIINSKETKVTVHNVQPEDIQESFSIKGIVTKTDKINCISGKVTEPLNIKEGAQASVYINGKYYDGYLQSLKPHNDLSYTATVSIVSDKELKGTGEAHVYGALDKNVIIIPYSCIFTDEQGNKSVMIASKDYCVKRNVQLGKINNSNGTQIKEGLFPEEKIVLNPQGLKTGNRISYND